MHIDIACSFPLNEMVDAHMKHRGVCTMLGTKVKNTKTTCCVYELIPRRFLLMKPPSTVVLLPTTIPTKSCTMSKNPTPLFQTWSLAVSSCSISPCSMKWKKRWKRKKVKNKVNLSRLRMMIYVSNKIFLDPWLKAVIFMYTSPNNSGSKSRLLGKNNKRQKKNFC